MSSKSAVSALIGSVTGGSTALHFPHFPVSAMWAAGTRFFVPHDGQGRINAPPLPGSETRAEVEYPVPALVAVERPHVVDLDDGEAEEVHPCAGAHAADELPRAVAQELGVLRLRPGHACVAEEHELQGQGPVEVLAAPG